MSRPAQFVLPADFSRRAKAPVFAPDDLVASCRNRLDAIRLCVQLSRLSHDHLCDLLGIDAGHFTRMMQGRAYFPDTKSIELMMLCGNLAPVQFEARVFGLKLAEITRDEIMQDTIEDLQRQLADRRKAR